MSLEQTLGRELNGLSSSGKTYTISVCDCIRSRDGGGGERERERERRSNVSGGSKEKILKKKDPIRAGGIDFFVVCFCFVFVTFLMMIYKRDMHTNDFEI